MNNRRSSIDPWANLSSVAVFDSSAEIQEFKYVTGQNQIPMKYSLFTELLLELLCGKLEIEPKKKRQLYKSLYKFLSETKIIGDAVKPRECNVLRDRYRDKICELIRTFQFPIGNDNLLSISSQDKPTWTRYTTEFKETGFIANGGFGKVYKALNYLDGIEYAIKKIPIRMNDFCESQLDEVKTLAKLNHTNIVPYKGAWVEEISHLLYKKTRTSSSESSEYESSLKISEETSSSLISWQKESKENSVTKSARTKNESCNGFKKSVISKISEDTSSSLISWKKDSEENLVTKAVETMNETENKSKQSENGSQQLCQYNASKPFKPAILYIQMALCEKTLRQWMDERIEATPMSMIRRITTQVLEGIQYIHSNNIVHHDIKPSNIFISFSGGLRIQLGDFGLACPLQKEGNHSVQGTRMYAAREQLKGECTSQSDLYSLGIVLLELLVPMQTTMELIILIDQLKERKIPYELVAKYPEWMKTLVELVQDDPDLRPSAAKLLELLKKDKDLEIEKLQKDSEKQEAMIKSLQEKIRILEIENEILKRNQKYGIIPYGKYL